MGAFGAPNDPKAVQRFLEHARYPHLNRIMRAGGVDKLTAERLADAIKRAVSDTEMRRRAAELGDRIRAEDGVGQAVALVQQMVEDRSTTGVGTQR